MPWKCAFALQINAYRNFWINFTAKAKKAELYFIASYKTTKQCFSSWHLEEMGVYTEITVRGHNESHSQLLINSSHSQPKMCDDWPWQSLMPLWCNKRKPQISIGHQSRHILVQLLYRFFTQNLASTHCQRSVPVCCWGSDGSSVNRSAIHEALLKVQLLFKRLEVRLLMNVNVTFSFACSHLCLQKWVNVFSHFNRLKWITPALSVLVILRPWDQVQSCIFSFIHTWEFLFFVFLNGL